MLQICIGDYHLCQDCTKSLADTGSTGIDVQLFIFLKYEFHAACIRDTDTDTGILQNRSGLHQNRETLRQADCWYNKQFLQSRNSHNDRDLPHEYMHVPAQDRQVRQMHLYLMLLSLLPP